MSVPILGLPGDLMFWYPTAMVYCKCQGPMKTAEKRPFIVITGFGNMSVCPYCGEGYFIKGLAPDGQGGMNIVVEFVQPTPKSEVM